MVLIIKRFTVLLLCMSVLCFSVSDAHAQSPELSADCAVLMSGDGEIIFSRNEDKRVPVASTTKLMTAIVAIERLSLDTVVEIQPECCGIEGSSMYLKPGEKLSVEELLYGLMLVSGNDAALALAQATAGGVEEFAQLMNSKAEELGMSSSSFKNPHGLNAEGHYSTARDMAILMGYCMNNETFARIAGTFSYSLGQRMLVNHNKLLERLPGCVAGKTGYTKAAGRCLVSCCERDGLRLICVTLSAPDDWQDHTSLYAWGYSNYCLRNAADGLEFQVSVVSGGIKQVKVVPAEKIMVFCRRDEALQAVAELPRFVFAPVEKGEAAGAVQILRNGTAAGCCPLVFDESVSRRYME